MIETPVAVNSMLNLETNICEQRLARQKAFASCEKRKCATCRLEAVCGENLRSVEHSEKLLSNFSGRIADEIQSRIAKAIQCANIISTYCLAFES